MDIFLIETLDFNVTAKAVAQSASRALGFPIAKGKTVTYKGFSKLYYSLVFTFINYGDGIWGIKTYFVINKVQNSGSRFVLPNRWEIQSQCS